MKKIVTLIIIALVAVTPLNVFAAKGDQGVDLSIWNGYQATFGYTHDKFSI
ncbi:1,4-beta-N-acetylmuramidase, partial [Enterococcus faecalis]